MLKKVINEICREKPAGLSVICARPGDGRRTFGIELSNDLAIRGRPVCFCSITRTKKALEKKLLPGVRIVSAFPDENGYFFKRLRESARAKDGIVLVDDLTAFSQVAECDSQMQKTSAGNAAPFNAKNKLLARLKELAIERNLRIIVTDTFAYASMPDTKLPLSGYDLDLCDRVYILYKNPYNGAKDLDLPDSGIVQLKRIK